MKARLDPAAWDLIVSFESGGKAYYNRRLIYPTVPPGSSGVTIGFGYDLGYEKNFVRDWSELLTNAAVAALERCIGKRGSQAMQALSGVRWITVPWEFASEVYNERTLPQEIRLTLKTFPGSADILPAPAFGALVSLIFNRGSDLDGPRRREMLAIRELISEAVTAAATRPPDFRPLTSDLCRQLAAQFRSMKRLWTDDKDSDGDLYDRREAEAKLIESSAA